MAPEDGPDHRKGRPPPALGGSTAPTAPTPSASQASSQRPPPPPAAGQGPDPSASSRRRLWVWSPFTWRNTAPGAALPQPVRLLGSGKAAVLRNEVKS